MSKREPPKAREAVLTPEGAGVVLAASELTLGSGHPARRRLRVGLDGGGYWTGFDTDLLDAKERPVLEDAPN
jgi:hypothetical protein